MKLLTLMCQLLTEIRFCLGRNTDNMVLDSLMDENAMYNVPVQTRLLAVTKPCQPSRLVLQTNLSRAFEDGVKHLFPYV